MQTIKGPAIFLAQFMGDTAPFNSLKSICEWAKGLGFAGVRFRAGTEDASTCKKQQRAKPMQMRSKAS
jgi:sugar phosphate isomerase/epimerase